MYRNVHTNTHVGATRIGTTALSLYNSDYAVRWAGFVRATTAGTYEFKTELLGANNSDIGYNANTPSYERVRLWIGNRMVIDQWDSLSSYAPLGTFAMGAGDTRYSTSPPTLPRAWWY